MPFQVRVSVRKVFIELGLQIAKVLTWSQKRPIQITVGHHYLDSSIQALLICIISGWNSWIDRFINISNLTLEPLGNGTKVSFVRQEM